VAHRVQMSAPCQTYVGVVDDDENVCRAMSRLLRAEGFQPVSYPSAEAFLADNKRPVFDCLVLDVQLGGMSGIELHRQLDSSGSSTPVVYVTAHDEPGIREEAQDAGCAGYFRKTDPGEDVLQAIRRAVATSPTAERSR
jgi:FixJ family two-component response regulator